VLVEDDVAVELQEGVAAHRGSATASDQKLFHGWYMSFSITRTRRSRRRPEPRAGCRGGSRRRSHVGQVEAGGGQVIELAEQDRATGDRDQDLGAIVGERGQARAHASGEDDGLHRRGTIRAEDRAGRARAPACCDRAAVASRGRWRTVFVDYAGRDAVAAMRLGGMTIVERIVRARRWPGRHARGGAAGGRGPAAAAGADDRGRVHRRRRPADARPTPATW
jgi:hypothetical protein